MSEKNSTPSSQVDVVVMCVNDFEHTVKIENGKIYQHIEITSRNIDKSLLRDIKIKFNEDGSLRISKFDWTRGANGDNYIYIKCDQHQIDLE